MATQTPTKKPSGTGQRLDYAAAEGLTETQQRGLAEESWRSWMIFAIAGTALLALIAVIFGVVAIAQSDKELATPVASTQSASGAATAAATAPAPTLADARGMPYESFR